MYQLHNKLERTVIVMIATKLTINGDHSRGVSWGILVLTCFAFGAFWSSELFVRFDATFDSLFLHHAGKVAKILVCFFIAYQAWRKSVSPQCLFELSCVFLPVAIILLFIASLTDNHVLSICANAINGIVGAFITLLFAQFFSSIEEQWSQPSIPFAFMLCCTIFIVLLPYGPPEAFSLVTAAAGPVLFFICLVRTGFISVRKTGVIANAESDESGSKEPDGDDRMPNPSGGAASVIGTLTAGKALAFFKEYYVVILGALILPIFYGMVAQIYSEAGIDTGLYGLTTEAAAMVVLLAMSLLSLSKRGLRNLDRIIIVLLPLLVTTLMLAHDRFFIAGAIVKSAGLLFTAIYWVFLTKKARGNPQKVFLYLGIAQGTNLLAVMIGRFIGHSLSAAEMATVDISLAIIILVIWMTALISWQLLPRHEKTEVIFKEREAGGFENMCARFSQKVMLTDRERQVLDLFVHGRSASFIARRLSISLSTTKTHLRNIYIKAGVHSRQELLDLVEELEKESIVEEFNRLNKVSA